MKALKTVDIKGKQYVEVKERLLALAEERDLNQIPYSIETTYDYIDSRKMWIVKATLTWNGNVYTGLAQEIESDNYKEVNHTSALENCETSAVGRACAMAGIGIIEGVASADEVKKAINRGSQFNNSDLPWMNDPEFAELKKNKNMFNNSEEAIATAKKKYKLSKAMEANIRGLWETTHIEEQPF